MSAFLLSLTITLLLFGAVVLTGLFGLRRQHLGLVFAATASLAVTVYYAKLLGEIYDLESAGWSTPVHLMTAKIATAAILGPILTGVMTWRNVVHVRKHRVAVLVFLALVVLALATGAWMIFASEPLSPIASLS